MKVAVIFDMLGPYHFARLNALTGVTTTLGIEVSGRSSVYAWDRVEDRPLFERQTLFEVEDSRLLPRSEVERALSESLGRFQPDVVFVPGWATPAALSAARWCFKSGVATVVMSESTRSDARRSAWKEAVKQRFISNFDAGLVGGIAQKSYLASLGMPESAIALGYNAVDNRYFAEGARTARAAEADVRRTFGLPDRYFLASARFIPIKNLATLLDAYAAFRRLRPASETKLVLLGDGAEADRLRAKVEALGMAAHVLMPGFKQYRDLAAYYGLARAFVHVSEIEPWGLVVNEAMAAGLPVVVSRETGCAQDLVSEGRNGFIVDCRDVDGIAARLAVFDDADEARIAAMGTASAEIVGQYAPDRFAAGAVEAARVALARRDRARPFVNTAAAAALSWLA